MTTPGIKRYFTDYPIVELGDTLGQTAPIRELRAVYWFDGEKYVIVLVGGHKGEDKIIRGAVQIELAYYHIYHKVEDSYLPLTLAETINLFGCD